MVQKLYTQKIKMCLDCPNCSYERENGKRHSTSKCNKTGIFIATGTKDIPTREQELNVWKMPSPFPPYCPLEDCE